MYSGAKELRSKIKDKTILKIGGAFDAMSAKLIEINDFDAVWASSAYLWAAWLSHDVANIAVYLPRQLNITLLLIVISYFTILL